MLGPINIVSLEQGRGVWREGNDDDAGRSPTPDRRWVRRMAVAVAALCVSPNPVVEAASAPPADIPADVL